MTREKYQQDLAALRAATLAMGRDAARKLTEAVALLRNPDAAIVRELVEGDDVIDRQYLDIERRCLDLLALQQPVAGDLRLIAASFKISTDIERVADLALNLGQYAQDLHANLRLLPRPQALFDLGQHAGRMIEDALGAYADQDADAALRVIHADDQADQAFWSLTHDLVAALMQTSRVSTGLPEDTATGIAGMLLAIRDLERAADHAVNIAARALYMAQGQSQYI